MTRFELASALSAKLFMLEESERHSIINSYINAVNMKMEDGVEEAAAISELGDIDLLADRILARHHIETNPPRKEKPEEIRSDEEKEENAEPAPESEPEEAGEPRYEKSDVFKDASQKAEGALKRGFGAAGGLFKGVGKGTKKFTFNIINVLILIFLFIPSMFITALGLICTAAVWVLYIASGIGFLGVCVAGVGCCIVGVSFCLWLADIMTGGEKSEKNC